MNDPTGPATDRQRRYLADLLTRAGAAGLELAGLELAPSATKEEHSAAIATLAGALGDEGRRRPARRRSSSRRRQWNRCTHEDYPCCGCDPDSRVR